MDFMKAMLPTTTTTTTKDLAVVAVDCKKDNLLPRAENARVRERVGLRIDPSADPFPFSPLFLFSLSPSYSSSALVVQAYLPSCPTPTNSFFVSLLLFFSPKNFLDRSVWNGGHFRIRGSLLEQTNSNTHLNIGLNSHCTRSLSP